MQIYTSCTRGPLLRDTYEKYKLGTMVSASDFFLGKPQHYTLPVALDNGAFSSYINGYGFNEFAFLKLLDSVIKKKIKHSILVTPDIVAGGVKSLEFSLMWRDRLSGWDNQYLAVQDGMDVLDVSGVEHKFKGIFVGGTKEWKWKTAYEWVKFAHDNNIKCHIGRCGTVDKMVSAYQMGADSIDSTNFNRSCNFNVIDEYLTIRDMRLFKEEK